MRILIVDDSAVMRKVVERAVRLAGMDVTDVLNAENGVQGLQTLREERDASRQIAMIFSDINMPEMDGLTFLEELKKEKLAENVPIIMITTEGTQKHVLRALAAGAKGYVCKPFSSDQIKSSILPLLATA